MNSQSSISRLWNGGAFVACDSVPISDRGFRYGMAVFESLPIYRGTPLFLKEHCERLQQACTTAGLKAVVPSIADFDALLRSIGFDGFARIYVTAGDGDVCADSENGRVFVFVEPRPMRGFSADDAYKVTKHAGIYTPVFEGLKTANYWTNIAALQPARQKGLNEALLFNANGELVSACMANVFVMSGGKIKTPSTACSAREGVIRAWVMKRRGVEECCISPDELADADEIFLTSSGLGVMPVTELDGHKLPSRSVADELRVEYAAEIDKITQRGQAV